MIKALGQRLCAWVRAGVLTATGGGAYRDRALSLERELKLQRNINVHLNARMRRDQQEWERDRTALYGEVPGLTPGEIERLAILAEECGAVAQAVGKILRFGWESQSPYGGRPNRANLEREIGNVRAIVNLMIDADDLRLRELQTWQRAKRAAYEKWTLYQEGSMPREEQLRMLRAIAASTGN